MSILSVQNLKMNFIERLLFEDVSFEVEQRDKIGLIGANGCGKTTLFKIITNQLEPTSGAVYPAHGIKIGYMGQHACEGSDKTLYDELVSVFDDLADMEKELEEISLKIENNEGDRDNLIKRQLKLHDDFNNQGGLIYKSRTKATLIGLGFEQSDFDLPVSILSGGQRSKLSLAKLLLSRNDILLLDEPTNHLDINSIAWLEGFIKEFKGAVMVISHDRYFLDSVTDKTLEIEHRHTLMYKGNYSEFKKKKEKLKEDEQHAYVNKLKEIKRVEGIIEQQRRFGQAHNFITAASKQKQLDRLKNELIKPEEDEKTVNFSFDVKRESGNDVLICDKLKKSFDGKKLFDNVSFMLKKGERVFVLGANGTGKTTLLRILTEKVAQDSGSFIKGVNVDIGYFDQLQSDLNLEKTPFDEIHDDFPSFTQTKMRSLLGRFLFIGDDVFKPIKTLSGGERARITLLKLMLKGTNFLLLDEPTNHLDTASREMLEDTLSKYTGTMLIVSHDRYFINKTATRIIELSENSAKDYNGNYDYYLEKKITEVKPLGEKESEKSEGSLSYKEQKARQSAIRKVKTRISRCEAQIECFETEIEENEHLLASQEIASDYARLNELMENTQELKAKLDAQYELWEECQSELEQLEAFST